MASYYKLLSPMLSPCQVRARDPSPNPKPNPKPKPSQERTRYAVRRAHHTKQEGIKTYRRNLDQITGKSTNR